MKRAQRFLMASAAALVMLTLTWTGTGRLLGQNAERPATEFDILTVAPFDRVTLIDGSVHYVEPVLPRPLPPYDPSKAAKKSKGGKDEIPAEGNIGLPGEKSKINEEPDKSSDPNEVSLHLLTGDVRDFRVNRASLRNIEYFEDLLLAESDRYRLAKEFSRAFECCLRVQARDPAWRGLDDHVNQILFAEGSAALLNADTERGLRLLRELSARKPDFPGLADKLAASYGGRANRAFDLGLYSLGRRILHDVEPLAPNHSILHAVRQRFLERATTLSRAASSKVGADRLDDYTEALRVWPALEGVDPRYREAFLAEPTLEVAVSDVSRFVGPWTRTPADARIARLLYHPILESDDEEAMNGQNSVQLAGEIATSDLGRSLVIPVRPGFNWSDGSRPVSAIDVARSLTEAAEPTSPRFAARWADLLDRVDIRDESHVEVRLTRAFLRPGAWLIGPVGPAHGGSDGRVATANRSRELVVDGLYRLAASSADRLTLSLADKPDASGIQPRIRRIKEVRYANPRAAIAALTRGEVALVEHVPADRVAEFATHPEIKLGRYERPQLHMIAIDGRNPVLRNRSLRRGLSYAIDRKTLLEETVLRRSSDDKNLVSDGPFPRGNYADAPEVKPLGFDPLLARMLVAAARKELGGQPIKLTLEFPAIAEAQAVVPKIADVLRGAGIELSVVEKLPSDLESELRAGRRFDLAYRVASLEEPVVDIGPVIAPAYDAVPSTDPLTSVASPRILQLLLELERAPEWPSARGVVTQIDRESRDELPVLPLWQLEDHFAYRTRLKGIGDSAVRLYDGIASWEIEPWYAKDPW